MKYSDRTIAYYEKMKNTGGFDENLPSVGTGIVGSPLCGDVMKLQLFFSDVDVIVDAKYKVFGCVSAIASMELTTTLLRGKTIDEAREIKNEDVAQSLELSEIKRHCSVLAKESIDAAIEDYISKRDKVNQVITITDRAVSKITELLEERGNVGLLITIGCGVGCSSSIDYALSYVANVASHMCTIEARGIKFFYAPEIELIIRGINIDVAGDDDECGFVVTNKYHKPCQNCTCGCGRS